jgi:hypothetical protein
MTEVTVIKKDGTERTMQMSVTLYAVQEARYYVRKSDVKKVLVNGRRVYA